MLLKGRRAQFAVEYLMVLGLVLVIVVPAAALFYAYAIDSSSQIDSGQVDKFIKEVLNGAESVHALGPPSRTVLSQRLPDSVESIAISPNAMVRDPADRYVLRVSLRSSEGVSTVSYPTDVPMFGRFSEDDVAGGVKRVFVEAKRSPSGENFVAVSVGRPVSRVFMSRGLYNGNLGGLAGADSECNRLAHSEGFSGSWKAWLSNSTLSAKDRVRDAKYVLAYGGEVVANNKDDLTDGTIGARINVTELSFRSGARVYSAVDGNVSNTDFNYISSEGGGRQLNNMGVPIARRSYRAWTGTLADGSSASVNCDDWTTNSSSRYGVTGRWPSANGKWTDSSVDRSCSSSRFTYCFES